MMKNTVFSFSLSLAVGFSFSLSSAAEQSGPGKGKRPDLSKLDKNGDKAITAEEAGPTIWARLGKLDKDGDGKIAGAEFPRSAASSKGGGSGEWIKRMDKDGDGNLSKEEVPAQAWAKLGKLDKNGDNTISSDEFAAVAKGRPSAGMSGDMFAKIDKNSDGKITETEAPRFWEKLSKADRDKDGAVSKEEMAAARAYMEQSKSGGMMNRGKGQSGGPVAIFGKYDGDKDGKLSKEEVPEELWGKLSRADNNADGLVSRDELAEVYKKTQGMMGPAPETNKPKRPAIETEA